MPVQQPPFGVQSRHAETTRFNTGYRLRQPAGLSVRVTVFVGGADDIGNGLRKFRFFVVAGATSPRAQQR